LRTKPGAGGLVAAVHSEEALATGTDPVVAFVGRSNVGKSSLLNRLLGTGSARIGKKPGKTRGIYFYETGEGHQYADLPGAGFARVSRTERERWGELADALFASGRVKVALRLVDGRVPEARADLAVREYLEEKGIPSVAVATKWDRIAPAERTRLRRRLEAAHGTVLAVSSKTGEGIDLLRREIRRKLEDSEESSDA